MNLEVAYDNIQGKLGSPQEKRKATVDTGNLDWCLPLCGRALPLALPHRSHLASSSLLLLTSIGDGIDEEADYPTYSATG
jgi:hypothetical protein